MKIILVTIIAICITQLAAGVALDRYYENHSENDAQQLELSDDNEHLNDEHGYAYEQPAVQFVENGEEHKTDTKSYATLEPNNYDLADFVYNPTNYFPEDRTKHYELGSLKKSKHTGPVKRLKLKNRKQKCNEDNEPALAIDLRFGARPTERRLNAYTEVETNEEYFNQ